MVEKGTGWSSLWAEEVVNTFMLKAAKITDYQPTRVVALNEGV